MFCLICPSILFLKIIIDLCYRYKLPSYSTWDGREIKTLNIFNVFVRQAMVAGGVKIVTIVCAMFMLSQECL